MSPLVERRLEVHAAAEGVLEPVAQRLEAAEDEGRMTILALERTPRPPSLRVRLRGDPETVARAVQPVYE